MKHTIISCLQQIVIIIIVIVFLIKISDHVEKYLLSKPKEECWLKFLFILFVIGFLYYLFYSFLWQKCIRYVQKSLYRSMSLNNVPHII